MANSDGPQGDDGWYETTWSPSEKSLLVELFGSGVHFDEISKRLPSRGPLSCRHRYRELHDIWSEELKRKIKIASAPTIDALHEVGSEQNLDTIPPVLTKRGSSSLALDGTGSIF